MGWRPQPRYDRSRNSWHCRYKNKKHYLGTTYPEACERFAKIIGTDAVIGQEPVTVMEAIESWLLANSRGPWARGLLKTWDAYAGNTPLCGIKSTHLADFVAHLKAMKTQGAWTIRHKINLASQILTWCVKRGYLDTMPEVPKTPTPAKRPRDIDRDTLAKAFATLPKRAAAVLEFILQTACRPGEARNLLWSEVDMQHEVCELTHHKTAHAGRTRVIYLTPSAIDILAKQARTSDYVFPSGRGGPYTHSGLYSIAKRHGLDSVYGLRHTGAQSMLESGVAMEDVSAHLGHKDLRMVQVYCQVRPARARKIAQNLPSALPPQPAADSTRPTSDASSKRQSKRKPNRRKSGKARVA